MLPAYWLAYRSWAFLGRGSGLDWSLWSLAKFCRKRLPRGAMAYQGGSP